jgi:hypothetical protein
MVVKGIQIDHVRVFDLEKLCFIVLLGRIVVDAL